MDRKLLTIILYLAILFIVVGAELTVTYHSIALGLWIYAFLLLFLVGVSSFSLGGGGDIQNLMKCLTLAPLIRMLSMSMPVYSLEQVHWYVIINTPLLVVAFLLVKSQNLGWGHVGLRLRYPGLQLLVAFSGIFLGLMDYVLLRPSPLVESLSLSSILVPSLVLLVFTGFSEELVFRGIIQGNAGKVVGDSYGLVLTSALFAAMHIGWQSLPSLVFVFGVGLFYGFIFQRTGSLWGITLSHGVTNIMMFLIAPFLL